jgi:hypothetical protein
VVRTTNRSLPPSPRIPTTPPLTRSPETKFQPTLPGISPLGVPNDKVRRLVFLSGKILVDIEMSRFLESDKRKKEGLVRLRPCGYAMTLTKRFLVFFFFFF